MNSAHDVNAMRMTLEDFCAKIGIEPCQPKELQKHTAAFLQRNRTETTFPIPNGTGWAIRNTYTACNVLKDEQGQWWVTFYR